jgi:hypothetical protein
MAKLSWGTPGARVFESGVDKGVLYRRSATGAYDKATPWVGLVSVTESPSGAESNKQYADNTVYANLVSAEELSATVEAFTYPPEFAACDGSAEITAGVSIGQQKREIFGLSYRTKIGNDLDSDAGYKLHLLYGAQAAPTEKAYTTINDSPEALTFSWELTTTPVDVPGFKPTALLTIDSTKVNSADLAALEALLYGTTTDEAELPLPADIVALFESTTDAPPA